MSSAASEAGVVEEDVPLHKTLVKLNKTVWQLETALSAAKAKINHTRLRTGTINEAVHLGNFLILPSVLPVFKRNLLSSPLSSLFIQL